MRVAHHYTVLLKVLVFTLCILSSRQVLAFGPGEVMRFDGSFLGVKAGEATVTIAETMTPATGAVDSSSNPLWEITAKAKTTGVTGWAYNVRQTLRIEWDAKQGLARKTELEAYEGDYWHQDTTVFLRDEGRVNLSKARRRGTSIESVPASAEVQDLASVMFWLRTRELGNGQHLEIPMIISWKPSLLVIDVVGEDRVKTRAGRFDCLKLRVRTSIEGNFSTKRDIFVWITKDARRIPVRMSAEFRIGSMVVELKQYSSGPASSRTEMGPAAGSGS